MRALAPFALGLCLSFSVAAAETSPTPPLFSTLVSANSALRAVPDGYFEKVDIRSLDIFTKESPQEVTLFVPRFGNVVLVKEELSYADLNHHILKWSGHLKDHQELKASFTRNLRGFVAGSLDTPSGRLLLGQLGDYILYKEAKDRPREQTTEAAVFDYTEKLAADVVAPAKYAYPLDLGVAKLAEAKNGDVLPVTLPGPINLSVTKDSETAGQFGTTTFVGHLTDFGDDFRMLVTYSASGAEGRLLTPSGEFLIRTLEGRTWLVDVARSGLIGGTPAMVDAMVPDLAMSGDPSLMNHMAHALTSPATTAAATSVAKAVTGAAVEPPTKIDLLVAYTSGMLSAFKTTQGAMTRIQYLVSAANQAYIDSGINLQLNLVGAVQHPGPDSTDNVAALKAMTNAVAPFDSIKTTRNQKGADLVVLLRPFSFSQGGSCGVAWVSGYNMTNVSAYAESAYAVISDATIDGKYYCSDYTIAHELGHSFGAMHDRATVQSQGGGVGAYPYGFGYSVASKFGTIMSYQQPYVGRFSNPNMTCSGVPCGVSETKANSANNALAMNNTRTAVAAFRNSVGTTATNYSLNGVVSVNGAGKAGVTITASPTLSCVITASNGIYSCTAPTGWTGTITPSLAGFTFAPAKLTVAAVTANVSGLNFQGTAASVTPTTTTPPPVVQPPAVAKITVSGSVVMLKKNAPAVQLKATGGAVCSAVDSAGKYTCTMNSGWTGTIVPSATGVQFAPAGVSGTNLKSSYPGINFYGF